MASRKTGMSEQASTKPVDLVTELAEKQRVLRQQLDTAKMARMAMADELVNLIAGQRESMATRQPLVQASDAARNRWQEAKNALARHLSTPTENVYAEKLQEAKEASDAAAGELADFDNREINEPATRIAELRAAIPKAEQDVAEMEHRFQSQHIALREASEARATTALVRVLSAYQDLYTVFESEGIALDRLRSEKPEEYASLLRDLAIDQQRLFDMIAPACVGGGRSGLITSTTRPVLVQQQKLIRDRIARLSPGK